MESFLDRTEAGRLLGARLAGLRLVDPLVLALPRGGVPVGLEVARALNAPLELLLVRKIGAPQQPELAIAALVDGASPQLLVDSERLAASGADMAYVQAQAKQQLAEIGRRRQVFLRGRPSPRLESRTLVLVDDGIATGLTVRAALQALRLARPSRIVLAIPVAPSETVTELRGEVDDLICLLQPVWFDAVGRFYSDFHQVEDGELIDALATAPGWSAGR